MSLSIQKSDAFGFHTYNQFKGKLISISNSMDVNNPILQEAEKKFQKINLVKNLVTAAGYIPVVGTIAAIAKLVLINKAEKEMSKDSRGRRLKPLVQNYFTGQKIRSGIELTSLGFLLLIPDIIFTIGRNIGKKPAEAI